jgi:hypothetical protein|tara:strand:- start:14963 stop:15133 length:171 start_codon:yes stop_codon:yes gene_type:complete
MEVIKEAFSKALVSVLAVVMTMIILAIIIYFGGKYIINHIDTKSMLEGAIKKMFDI